MADPGFSSTKRDPIKSSVGKERRESLVRAKRLCRVGISDVEVDVEGDMMIDEEQSILESQTSLAVQNLKSALAYQ
ncbi:importin subunit alpha-2-like [Trifolium medium]|uniref:Importin subunit alpha-2-like n=1 Tax=Trifolium medium TaxID=97028 RepID=A0A392PWP9_9FABA|nr:importin subunit alpha-2-like [Trifolium medium]